jgi:nucleoside 2-deoxyribosyltransferase
MWFDSSMDDAYSKGISPAITDSGFSPFRVDRKESNNQITDEIIAGIRQSRFMVADMTGHRSAVYYEAGMMYGLGRPVIFTCKEDHFKNASFDTNHYSHVIWKTPEELREKLLNRIRATIID